MMNRIDGDFLREKNFFYKRKTESGGTVVGKRWERIYCMIVRDNTAFVIVEMAFDGIKAPYQKQ